MNGVNLHLFQFERDLTWMSFFMDADDGIYARYGGREDHDPESHLNKQSLVRVMRQVLEWHATGTVKAVRPEAVVDSPKTPESIPTMKGMMASRKESKCIHCHDVKVATFRDLQASGKFKREMVFTYPAPSTLGIILDPFLQNEIDSVRPDSAADRAGIRAGDVIESLDGKKVHTFADVQAALEPHTGEAALDLTLRRGDQTIRTTVKLAGNWRRSRDPSWHESLHVAGPGGGFWGEKLKEPEKRNIGIAPDGLAVRITAIFGAHAREAGLKNGDVVVEFDGLRRDMTILQLHAHLQLDREYGATIPMVVRRAGMELRTTLHLPKEPDRGG